MSKASEAVKLWRKRTKERIVESMGGKCVCCGYDYCNDALDLHHLDPTEKEFCFGSIKANCKSWAKIVVELRKCILLCSRCHREIHSNMRQIPKNPKRFDENYINYTNNNRKHKKSYCPICGKEKEEFNKTCSHSCAAKLNKMTDSDWEKIDIYDLRVNKNFNWCQIADMVGISSSAAQKRFKKIYGKWVYGKRVYIPRLKQRKVERPTEEQILEDLKKMSCCAIGRKYNVSDNCIRKWLKYYKKEKNTKK